MTNHELKNVAPKLLEIENSEISVPGLYRSDRKIVRIGRFGPVLPVLRSK